MTDNLDDIKRALEIQKLRIEVKHYNRSFFAQITNTMVIGGIAIAVLYFSQRPQVLELEATREQSEKNNIATLILSVQNLKDPKEKHSMIVLLSNLYPQYTFIRDIEKGIDELNIASEEKNQNIEMYETDSQHCETIRDTTNGLRETIQRLNDTLAKEDAGLGQNKTAGKGPAYQAITTQLNENKLALDILVQTAKRLKC